MYPKPLTGFVSNLDNKEYNIATRSHYCTTGYSVSVASAAFWNEFGFRSKVIKSDGYRPTPYKVWWSKVNVHPGSLPSGRGICYPPGAPQFSTYLYSRGLPDQKTPLGINYGGAALYALTGWNSRPDVSYDIGSFFSGASPRHTAIRVEWEKANNNVLLQLAHQTHLIGITLSEVPKTTRYLTDKLRELGRALVGIKNAPKTFFKYLKRNYRRMFGKSDPRRRKARCHLNQRPWDAQIGARWLEYSYAITPLVFDINGILELADVSSWPPIRFSRKRRFKFSFYLSNTSANPHSHAFVEGTGMVQHNVEIEDPLKFALSRMGATPAQFILGTAWELIPFSFVADWFLGFNDLLKGISAYQGLKFNHGFSSLSVKVNETLVFNNGGRIGSAMPGSPALFPTVTESMQVSSPLGGGFSMTHRFSGFERVVFGRPPSYNYSATLDITKRRALTILSLIAVLRK